MHTRLARSHHLEGLTLGSLIDEVDGGSRRLSLTRGRGRIEQTISIPTSKGSIIGVGRLIGRATLGIDRAGNGPGAGVRLRRGRSRPSHEREAGRRQRHGVDLCLHQLR